MTLPIRVQACVLLLASLACLASESPRATVMKINASTRNFQPCSRNMPSPIDGFWRPSKAVAREIDDHIDTALGSRSKMIGSVDVGILPIRMQLLGIVMNGDSLVYVNGLPSTVDSRAKNFSSQFYDVCDGGNAYWGILWDPKRKVFRAPSFNGLACVWHEEPPRVLPW